jgi:hypothetical protein
MSGDLNESTGCPRGTCTALGGNFPSGVYIISIPLINAIEPFKGDKVSTPFLKIARTYHESNLE